MNEDELLSQLSSNLSSALSSEARGDGDAAVAKTPPSRTSKRPLPLESSRDSMMDNHLLRTSLEALQKQPVKSMPQRVASRPL
jgi:hypothetical protein